jgi:hypothetical protein
MGTILTNYGDAGYEHEGYAAQVLEDGSLTSAYTAETTPRMVGRVVAACGCGWAGTIRYPTTMGPFDEEAQALALTEWEHSHARPVLQGLRLESVRRLRGVLEGLARQVPRLAPESLASSPAAGRLQVIERVLGELHGALELARELRESMVGDLE